MSGLPVSRQSGLRVPSGKSKAIWLWLIPSMYAAYVVLFYLQRGFRTFFSASSVLILPKIFLLVAPLYIFYVWRCRHRLRRLDYHMVYIPFAVWYAAFVTIGDLNKGLFNAIVELPTVGLLSGFYLLRFPITARWSRVNAGRVGTILCLVVVALAVVVAWLFPVFPD